MALMPSYMQAHGSAMSLSLPGSGNNVLPRALYGTVAVPICNPHHMNIFKPYIMATLEAMRTFSRALVVINPGTNEHFLTNEQAKQLTTQAHEAARGVWDELVFQENWWQGADTNVMNVQPGWPAPDAIAASVAANGYNPRSIDTFLFGTDAGIASNAQLMMAGDIKRNLARRFFQVTSLIAAKNIQVKAENASTGKAGWNRFFESWMVASKSFTRVYDILIRHNEAKYDTNLDASTEGYTGIASIASVALNDSAMLSELSHQDWADVICHLCDIVESGNGGLIGNTRRPYGAPSSNSNRSYPISKSLLAHLGMEDRLINAVSLYTFPDTDFLNPLEASMSPGLKGRDRNGGIRYTISKLGLIRGLDKITQILHQGLRDRIMSGLTNTERDTPFTEVVMRGRLAPLLDGGGDASHALANLVVSEINAHMSLTYSTSDMNRRYPNARQCSSCGYTQNYFTQTAGQPYTARFQWQRGEVLPENIISGPNESTVCVACAAHAGSLHRDYGMAYCMILSKTDGLSGLYSERSDSSWRVLKERPGMRALFDGGATIETGVVNITVDGQAHNVHLSIITDCETPEQLTNAAQSLGMLIAQDFRDARSEENGVSPFHWLTFRLPRASSASGRDYTMIFKKHRSWSVFAMHKFMQGQNLLVFTDIGTHPVPAGDYDGYPTDHNGLHWLSNDAMVSSEPIYLTSETESTRYLGRAVGIEFETGSNFPYSNASRTFIDMLTRAGVYTPSAPWGVKQDGSLCSGAVEVVTPPMRGHAIEMGIAAYYEAARQLRFATENYQAGGHIHVEATDLFEAIRVRAGSSMRINRDAYYNKVAWLLGFGMNSILKIAKEFVSRRRRDYHYCCGGPGVRREGEMTRYVISVEAFEEGCRAVGVLGQGRHGLEVQYRTNVQGGNSLGGGNRRATNYTLEFRLWPSSASPNRVMARAELSQKMVNWMIESVMPYIQEPTDENYDAVKAQIVKAASIVPLWDERRKTAFFTKRTEVVQNSTALFGLSEACAKTLTSIHRQFFGPTYVSVSNGTPIGRYEQSEDVVWNNVFDTAPAMSNHTDIDTFNAYADQD